LIGIQESEYFGFNNQALRVTESPGMIFGFAGEQRPPSHIIICETLAPERLDYKRAEGNKEKVFK
jgi:hypothetical protein